MYRKELTYYFSTPIAYIVVGLYQLAISLFLWVIPGQWTRGTPKWTDSFN